MINLPSLVALINDDAFKDCNQIQSISIPESATSIGQRALNGYSVLTELKVLRTVVSIETSALCGCSKLKK